MKKKLIILIIFIIAIAAITFFLLNNKKSVSKTENTYTTSIVQAGDINIAYEDEGSADLGTKELSFTIDGTIDKIFVKENDIVTKDTVLATLKADSLVNEMKSAEIAYQNAQITYEKSKASEQSDALSINSSLKQAKTKADSTKDLYERLLAKYKVINDDFNTASVDDTTLNQLEAEYNAMIAVPDAYSENELVSKKTSYENEKINYANSVKSAISELKEAYTSYESALADYNKAQISYNLQNKNYDEKSSKLSIEKAQLDYEKAQDELDNSKLLAPYDCKILSVEVIEGDSVYSDDKTVVMQVKKTGNAKIIASISESDIGNISEGMAVEASSDNIAGKVFTGKVAKISNISTVGSGNLITYEVTIELDAEYPEIRDKMTFNLEFMQKQAKNCLYIPNDAVYMKNNEQYVKVQSGNNQVETKVKTGLSDGTNTEVKEGLTEGQTIIVETKVKTSSKSATSSTSSSKTSSKSSSSQNNMMPPMF